VGIFQLPYSVFTSLSMEGVKEAVAPGCNWLALPQGTRDPSLTRARSSQRMWQSSRLQQCPLCQFGTKKLQSSGNLSQQYWLHSIKHI